MKNKLRRLKIGNAQYLYSVVRRYYTNTQISELIIRIFLSGQKATPLILSFSTVDDYYLGHPLNAGVALMNVKTNMASVVNLNKPAYIRKFILQGIKNGWTGTNDIGMQDGLAYLEKFGFETGKLKPRNKA
ncbi:hypothetical protein [Foetidibacter luteolus]|uniref:hypothetical protein n=1 Tax=Foetidibacter luteolus TaxID=2608880 RepID=UPI00129A5E40|nr:hypothetical protein [Foetidibacter luteolus]